MQHFPVIAVMGLFLTAFLVEIFGNNKFIRNALTFLSLLGALVLMIMLVKPVMYDGEIISYWMGNWEPVSGYAIGIGYEVDSLGLFFALLSSLAFFLAAIYSFKDMEKDEHLGHFYTLFLMLAASVLGMVLTGDIFNMFVMIEIMTFAAVALTAFHNEKRGALESALKYLIIGSIGSSLVLVGIALLYSSCRTLNMAQIATIIGASSFNPTTIFAFAMLFAGMGIKAFMFPFHTPLADAHSVAPSAVSMVLSGVITKAGIYGLIRVIYTVFVAMNTEAVSILVCSFGTVTMFIGVTMALAQHDFKRLLAFHSISQIGYIITAVGLGTTFGLTAGLFHALNHTLFKGLLFLAAGAVLYATGSTSLDKLGGISKKMPKTTICFLIGAFSISGLPPFNGFASKWFIYQAIYEKAIETNNFFYVVVCVIAAVVSVMTLASFIKVAHSVFFGQVTETTKDAKEVPFLMRLPMWILSILCTLVGIFYQMVANYLLIPAVRDTFLITRYIDTMMGNGYAEIFGTRVYMPTGIYISNWQPIVWLVLFVIIFLAVGIVIITGKGDRGHLVEIDANGNEVTSRYKTFFSGEEELPSHMGGSDLFWGFKKNWKGYFTYIENLHSGVINDYCIWIVAALAIIIAYAFIFIA